MSSSSSSTAEGAPFPQIIEVHSLERAFLNMQNRLDERGVAGADIDAITPLRYETTGGRRGPIREHLLVAIETDGIRDIIWYSPAAIASEDDPLTLAGKPGLSEIIEDGVGWKYHKELANRNPELAVVTHATEGFGPAALKCKLWELPQQSLDRMAERGYWLLHTYFKDERIVTVGTSMGTVIFHKLLTNNRHETPSDQLQVAANINYAPALVDPRSVASDMFLKFPSHMLLDSVAEVLTRTNPLQLLEVIRTLAKSRPGLRDTLPMARQTLDLLKGVSEEDVLANAEFYPTAAIVGTRDPVGQISMWERLPVLLVAILGRGHAVALKPSQGAQKVTETIPLLLNHHGKPISPIQHTSRKAA